MLFVLGSHCGGDNMHKCMQKHRYIRQEIAQTSNSNIHYSHVLHLSFMREKQEGLINLFEYARFGQDEYSINIYANETPVYF